MSHRTPPASTDDLLFGAEANKPVALESTASRRRPPCRSGMPSAGVAVKRPLTRPTDESAYQVIHTELIQYTRDQMIKRGTVKEQLTVDSPAPGRWLVCIHSCQKRNQDPGGQQASHDLDEG